MNAETNTEQLDALAPYNKLRAQVEELKALNADKSFDYTKPSGIKAAKSHIYALRQRKADIERVRKTAKADALEYGRKVDGAAKELTAEVESMIELHQKPIDEIEQREAARKQRHEENMIKLAMPEVLPESSEAVKAIMDGIALTKISETWEEYEAPARKLRDETLQALADRHAVLVACEQDAAELEQHRKEAAARKQADREAKIAAEAAENARREAEAAAERKEAERAEAERKAREQAEAEKQAAIDAERAKAREAEERLEAERAATKAAAARASREASEKAEAEEKRKADADHRERILQETAQALARVAASPEDPAALRIGRMVADAIAEGRIPHVSMQF